MVSSLTTMTKLILKIFTDGPDSIQIGSVRFSKEEGQGSVRFRSFKSFRFGRWSSWSAATQLLQ